MNSSTTLGKNNFRIAGRVPLTLGKRLIEPYGVRLKVHTDSQNRGTKFIVRNQSAADGPPVTFLGANAQDDLLTLRCGRAPACYVAGPDEPRAPSACVSQFGRRGRSRPSCGVPAYASCAAFCSKYGSSYTYVGTAAASGLSLLGDEMGGNSPRRPPGTARIAIIKLELTGHGRCSEPDVG
ncbi:MAG: hypothetical protein JWM63_2705 [Gammaproteobacteria bacterium]|nr:hypothetical protein [Gammaproteobacteria bacterium]